MLIHYFITGLKPIDLTAPPPLSAEAYLMHARDCLSGTVLDDLERLAHQQTINQMVKRSMGAPRDISELTPEERTFVEMLASDLGIEVSAALLSDPMAERRLYWHWLEVSSTSPFLRLFARDAVSLFKTVAFLLARHAGVSASALHNKICWPENIDYGAAELEEDHDSDRAALHQHALLPVFEKALAAHDPLTLELVIAQELVNLASERSLGETFSLDQVFIYFIKLLLCERFASFDQVAGQAVLDEFLEQIYKGA